MKKVFLWSEDIGRSKKPTETGEIATTESNPQYGHYGMTRDNNTKAHFGTDYAGEVGDRVLAVRPGIVTRIYDSSSLGLTVQTKTYSIGGHRYYIEYSHLEDVMVYEGSAIFDGVVVGHMGRTGNIEGTDYPTHVHIRAWRYIEVNSKRAMGFVPVYWQ